MNEPRPVLPTDLLALVSYNGRSYPNEAWTRERLGSAGASPLPLGAAFEQFVTFARGRSAWISVQRQRLQGLVGARRRGANQAWEIDYLIDATAQRRALTGLLDCALNDVGRSGAEKLFLRLAAGSDLLEIAYAAGFIACREETLYARVGLPADSAAIALRPLNPSDSYLVYRLYNATTPEATRRNEAATFSEWHACQEQRWLRHGVQLVSECAGGIDAVVRAARLAQGAAVELLADGAARDHTPELIRNAVEAVSGEALPIFILASTTSGLCERLAADGFVSRGDYISLVRRTTRPVKIANLTSAIAETAIGV